MSVPFDVSQPYDSNRTRSFNMGKLYYANGARNEHNLAGQVCSPSRGARELESNVFIKKRTHVRLIVKFVDFKGTRTM